jgi:hypothetical protein
MQSIPSNVLEPSMGLDVFCIIRVDVTTGRVLVARG